MEEARREHKKEVKELRRTIQKQAVQIAAQARQTRRELHRKRSLGISEAEKLEIARQKNIAWAEIVLATLTGVPPINGCRINGSTSIQ